MKELFSSQQATALIVKGLEHGTLKLKGPVDAKTPEGARICADMDAMYLLTLLNALQKQAAA